MVSESQDGGLPLIAEVLRALLSDDAKRVIETIYHGLLERHGLDFYLFSLTRDGGRTFFLESHAGLDEEQAGQCRVFSLRDDISAMTIDERFEFFDHFDCCNNPIARQMAQTGLLTCACYPLQTKPRIYGMLIFGSRGKQAFAPLELEVMQLLSRHVALSLDRAESADRMQRHADELGRIDQNKIQFLSILGHELRNPLMGMSMVMQVMRMKLPPDSPVIKNCEMMSRQVEALTRLADDLLNATRIARGTLEVRMAEVNLSELARRVVDSCRWMFREREIEFDAVIPAEPIMIEADAPRIEQVVWNLLDNAAKYTNRGGTARMSVECVADRATINVRDSGMGMPAEKLSSIFELFSQSGAHRHLGGVGLGLPIVRRLVEMHGGTITASSAGLNQGSEFTVTLPARCA